MIVDGRTIARELEEELKEAFSKRGKTYSIGVLVAADDLATKKFIERKCEFGKRIGIGVEVYEFAPSSTTDEILNAVKENIRTHDGVVVQLPLPNGVDESAIRNSVSIEKDVDVISDEAMTRFEKGESKVLPPVIGAISEISKRNNLAWNGKKVVVIGSGRLVGRPGAVFAKQQGAEVVIVDSKTSDTDKVFSDAGIIISGAGVPGLLSKDMVKEGVVIFDAGTSEAKGKLAGDADSACSEKASLITPVPGGIGPITVAMIFKNLLQLSA